MSKPLRVWLDADGKDRTLFMFCEADGHSEATYTIAYEYLGEEGEWKPYYDEGASLKVDQMAEAVMAYLEREGLVVAEGLYVDGNGFATVTPRWDRPPGDKQQRVLVISDPRQEASDEQPI